MPLRKPPTYKEIPEHWKAPIGPYHQAPPEYGGEWWMINPFTPGGAEPWKLYMDPQPEKEPPDGFVDIFGPQPVSEDFRDYPNPSEAYRAALHKWQQDLRYFKRSAGTPEGYTTIEVVSAQDTFPHWKMGAARFYEGRYGWMARWPESQKRTFETTAYHAIFFSNDAARAYQISLLTDNIVPAGPRHPFVPQDLWDAVVKANEPG